MLVSFECVFVMLSFVLVFAVCCVISLLCCDCFCVCMFVVFLV